MCKRPIVIKIFMVILAFALSLILFIWAFWGFFLNKPNPLFAHLHFVISIIILVIVGALVVSHIIRIILKPLSVLNKAVEKAGKGDLEQHVEIKSNDEFGALADAFNRMTAELKKMILSREHLLSDVSHELRTPITRAWLALEMMTNSPEKESLAGDLKEMEAMITGILESERLKNGSVNLVPVKITTLFHKLMNNFQRESDRIRLMPVSDGLFIHADETLIMTALRNLVENSLKYSSVSDKPIEISVIQHNQDISISIEDFGPGIPEDKLPFVFEPFYKVDQSRSRKTGGYGLGLHLCKRIMDLHKAEIRLQNKKEETGLVVLLVFQKNSVTALS